MNIAGRLRAYADEYRESGFHREIDGTIELLEEAAEYVELLTDSDKRDVVFRKCICAYGTNPQIDVAVEELSELTKALMKWRRAKGAEATKARDGIIDELADVRIMVRQMEILFQCEDDVEKRIDFKVHRQEGRLDIREAADRKRKGSE